MIYTFTWNCYFSTRFFFITPNEQLVLSSRFELQKPREKQIRYSNNYAKTLKQKHVNEIVEGFIYFYYIYQCNMFIELK